MKIVALVLLLLTLAACTTPDPTKSEEYLLAEQQVEELRNELEKTTLSYTELIEENREAADLAADEARAHIVSLEDELKQSKKSLIETETNLNVQIDSLEKQKAILEDEKEEFRNLGTDYANETMELTKELIKLKAEGNRVTQQLATTEEELDTAENQLVVINNSLQEKTEELARLKNLPPYPQRLESEVKALEKEVRSLDIEKRDLLVRLYDLREEVPLLQKKKNQLEEAVTWLESRLEKARELILDYEGFIWTSPVHCSGSMEPRIGCTDRLVVESRPDPESIEIGQVISFRPSGYSECSGLPYGGILHRVEAKWQEFGENGYFWNFRTRGDNNPSPDPAIPEENVCHRLVAVDEDYYPKMAEAREQALEALYFLDSEASSYQQAVDNFIDAYSGFGASLTRQCRYSPKDGIYYCYDVASVRNAQQEARDAFATVRAYWNDYEEAWDAYKDKLTETRKLFRELYPEDLIAVPPL